MRDEIDGRIWAAHHDEFSDGIDALLEALTNAFAAPRRDAPCGRR
jgi:hypothetical protein